MWVHTYISEERAASIFRVTTFLSVEFYKCSNDWVEILMCRMLPDLV